MKLFLDCEFNGFGGELISMALVSEWTGRKNGKQISEEWYGVLPCENPCKWVAEHVMPILNKQPVRPLEFTGSLYRFLRRFPSFHIIADWPDDIAYFCRSLIVGPGQMVRLDEFTMEVRKFEDADSELPHNALCDARALRDAWRPLEHKKQQTSKTDDIAP